MTGGLEPLPGGMSGETFLSRLSGAGGEDVVVRIYAGRSASRGPVAPQVDAAVLDWVAGLLPVPRVLEVRAADPDADVPGLLVTELLPGLLLSELLPTLDEDALVRVGTSLGTLLGRLAHLAQPRPGLFAGPELQLEPLPEAWRDVASFVDDAAARLVSQGWARDELVALRDLALQAQVRLDTVHRTCLVHGDLNPENVLVAPETLEVTGILDWEFARSGSPYADLGNLLRHEGRTSAGRTAYVEAVLAAREAFVPDPRPDALELARCADLPALVDLACRVDEGHERARRAAALLRGEVREHAARRASAGPLDSGRGDDLS